MGDHQVARLSFDRGFLPIKMPSKLLEIINRLLARIMTILTEELDLETVDLESATLDRPDLGKGVEPNTCFYIQNTTRFPGINPQIPDILPPIG